MDLTSFFFNKKNYPFETYKLLNIKKDEKNISINNYIPFNINH